MTTHSDPLLSAVDQTVNKSVDYLFQMQSDHGGWQDYTTSSAVITAVAMLCLHHADPEKYATFIREGCAWLRQEQRPDGGWGTALVDVSTIDASSLATAALKIADPTRSASAIERGLAFLQERGGVLAVKQAPLTAPDLSVLALAGFEGYTWDDIPRLPIELLFFPASIWRKTSFIIPPLLCLSLLQSRKVRLSAFRRWLVRRAESRILKWLRANIGENGGYQESPLMVCVLFLCLTLANTGKDIAEHLMEFILATRRADGSWTNQYTLEVSVTTYILEALESVGRLDDSRVQKTKDRLFWQQFTTPFYPTGAPAGAWSWGKPSGWADMDDTSGALTMLRRMGVPASDPRMKMGYHCLKAMQNRDGSWSMFVPHNKLPMDAPCPALAARIAIALYEEHNTLTPPIKRVLAYLARVQRIDGAIHNIWFHDFVYGTGLALELFATLGRVGDPVAQRCLVWLLANQNDDGSWGGVRGTPGTVEETAWALSALLAHNVSAPPASLDKAADWLTRQQRPNGSWEPAEIGLYYPDMWYSDEHIANGFALRALGRYWHWRTGKLHAMSMTEHLNPVADPTAL